MRRRIGARRYLGESDRLSFVMPYVPLGDHGCGALERSFLEVFAEEIAHMRVALACGPAAEHDTDEITAVAMQRGYEIEAGGPGEAGLDAVDPLNLGEQMVVIADGLATAKNAIARVAATLVGPALSVGLDAGTTILTSAQQLAGRAARKDPAMNFQQGRS